MKHYGQACAIARALDVVGERWNLSLVRELTWARAATATSHRPAGHPSNVLAARLRTCRPPASYPAHPPGTDDVTVYELTEAAGRCSPHSKSCWTGVCATHRNRPGRRGPARLGLLAPPAGRPQLPPGRHASSE